MEWIPSAVSVVGKPAASGSGESQKIDWREALDEESFRVFAALRAWRKERAKADGVPIYAVATNEQLAAISRDRAGTKAALAKVEGFGAGRMAKYGDAILAVYSGVVVGGVAASGTGAEDTLPV